MDTKANFRWDLYLGLFLPIAFVFALITGLHPFAKSRLDEQQEKLLLTCNQLQKVYSNTARKDIYTCLDGTPEGIKRLQPGYRPPNPNN